MILLLFSEAPVKCEGAGTSGANLKEIAYGLCIGAAGLAGELSLIRTGLKIVG